MVHDLAHGQLVTALHNDALALPLRDDEWGTFDLAHARFLLEHVRDPLAERLRATADQARMVAERLAPALLDVREAGQIRRIVAERLRRSS